MGISPDHPEMQCFRHFEAAISTWDSPEIRDETVFNLRHIGIVTSQFLP